MWEQDTALVSGLWDSPPRPLQAATRLCSDLSAPWPGGATFCTRRHPACPPGAATAPAAQGSLLQALMFSEAPRDSACGFWRDQARSQPPVPRVMHPLSPDPRFYQEIRERGLTTSQESDDDLLDEPGSPEGARTVGTPIVVKNFRAPQVTWSQLPEVGRLLGAPFPTMGGQSRGLPRRPSSPRRAVSRALRAARPVGHLVVSGGGGGGGVGAGAIQVCDGRPQVSPVLYASYSDWPLGSCGYQGPLLPGPCPQESARRSPEEAGGDGRGARPQLPQSPVPRPSRPHSSCRDVGTR